MTGPTRIRVQRGSLVLSIGQVIREARTPIGWSLAELGDRSGTSAATLSRIERGLGGALRTETLDRVLGALGLRVTLEVTGWHLRDRELQRDLVHAALVQALAGRLRRAGWEVATEVPFGWPTPHGWIDLLAYRRSDGALLAVEVKTILDDIGGMLRQVSRYEAAAMAAARSLGWQPETAHLAVVGLDSDQVAAAIAGHRTLLATEIPGAPDVLQRWIEDVAAPPPGRRRTLALADLAPRRGLGLLRSPLHARRTRPAYRDYPDAAEAIRMRRRRGTARPRRRTAPGVRAGPYP